MVNDTLLRSCEQEPADEREISPVFERKKINPETTCLHFSLMFHRGSNCAVKVKIFVLNVLERQLHLPGLWGEKAGKCKL